MNLRQMKSLIVDAEAYIHILREDNKQLKEELEAEKAKVAVIEAKDLATKAAAITAIFDGIDQTQWMGQTDNQMRLNIFRLFKAAFFQQDL